VAFAGTAGLREVALAAGFILLLDTADFANAPLRFALISFRAGFATFRTDLVRDILDGFLADFNFKFIDLAGLLAFFPADRFVLALVAM
jgi:hypothetical protein